LAIRVTGDVTSSSTPVVDDVVYKFVDTLDLGVTEREVDF
jgi:hypothetical protein